jgi:DNA helicase-2/ATP-dependent DNA helicase PcrA
VELEQTLTKHQQSKLQHALNNLNEDQREALWTLIDGDDFTLNPEQIEGLIHDHESDGPLLILAGAGSGKTAVMTRRIVWLYLKGFDPDEVMALTFTHKAGLEMRQRVSDRLGMLQDEMDSTPLSARIETLQSNLSDAWIGTFHSLGKRLLEQPHPQTSEPLIQSITVRYPTPLHILESDQQQQLHTQAYMEDLPDHASYDPDALIDRMIRWRRALITPRGAKHEASTEFERWAARFYDAYQTRKRKLDPPKVDFQDLLYYPARLLRENNSIREWAQSTFKHVLIDEFQDTNPLQFAWAQFMAQQHQRLYVVGDDAQSIYGWRGADIGNIQQFSDHFSDASILKLENNYRSNATIVMSANEVFEDDTDVYDKSLTPSKGSVTGLEYGKPVAIWECLSDNEERGLLGYEIQRLVHQRGYEYGDIVIFYRINRQKRRLSDYLERQDIPHRELGEPSFFEKDPVHHIRCWARILQGAHQSETTDRLDNVDSFQQALEGWLNRPESRLDEDTRDEINDSGNTFGFVTDDSVRQSVFESLSDPQQTALQKEWNVINEGYQFLSNSGAPDELWSILQSELSIEEQPDQALIKEWFDRSTESEGFDGLDRFLENVKEQIRDPQFVPGDPSRFVKLTTLHGAKGLEFPVVFMTGMEDGVCPYKHPHEDELDEQRLREEKRLFYVGITRAQERLNITWCHQRKWMGNVRTFSNSRFLNLLPDDLTVTLEPPRSFVQRLKTMFIR